MSVVPRKAAFLDAYERVQFPRQVIGFFPRKDNSTIKAIVVRPKGWKEIPLI